MLKEKFQGNEHPNNDFSNEMAILTNMRGHPGVVNIIGHGIHQKLPFMILEWYVNERA